jgi:hypothetical protein
VQALLVTKHLLFVGYSLSDEDFHELADEIRTALEPTAAERTQLGTVLTIEESALGRLWKDLFYVVRMGQGPPARAARRLQIFLDLLAHLTTPQHAYLLNPSFEGLLSDEEKRIAKSLNEVQDVVAASDHPTRERAEKGKRSVQVVRDEEARVQSLIAQSRIPAFNIVSEVKELRHTRRTAASNRSSESMVSLSRMAGG